MAVSRKCLGMGCPELDMRLQKLFVDAAAKKGGDMDFEFLRIHIIDQIHQYLFSTTLA